MRREERHTTILESLYNDERVEVEDLADRFGVSQETIRRDLTFLAERGLLRKVHGGAVRFQTAQEDTFTLRSQVHHTAKVDIGKVAASFVHDGDSIFLNAGTTTAVFAEQLGTKHDLTIITNCARIAETLWNQNQTHKIYLLGGLYNGTDTETNGSLVLNQIQMFRADHAFVTVGAVSEVGGLMEYRLEAAEIIRAMAQQSRATTIIVDSSKLNRSALIRVGNLSLADRIVSDKIPSESLVQALEEAIVELVVVHPEDTYRKQDANS